LCDFSRAVRNVERFGLLAPATADATRNILRIHLRARKSPGAKSLREIRVGK